MTPAESGSKNASAGRRHFRFTTRHGVAIFMLLMLVFVGPFAVRYWQDQRFREEVERLGGQIMTEEGGPFEFLQTDRRGDPRVATNVLLDGCELDDLWLTQHRSTLRRLPGKLYIGLSKSHVGDDGIAILAGMHLHGLGLESTRVTDEGLLRVVQIDTLEALDLRNIEATDAGLAELRQLPRLWALSLGGPRISDDTIPSLERLRGLRHLYLGKTQMTDRGVASLRKALPACRITVD